MGKDWDKAKGGRDNWIAWLVERMQETRRVLKPGAFGLVWALPRTSHWTATALEDAGFDIRDIITHLNGQGFPKGQACLKPAAEHWVLIRNPVKGSIKNNPFGLGNLNIDACRIPTTETIEGRERSKPIHGGGQSLGNDYQQHKQGRWPANVVLSHSEDCKGVGLKEIKGAKPKQERQPIDDQNNYGNGRKSGLGGKGNEVVGIWDCSPDCPVRMLDAQSLANGMHPAGGRSSKVINTNANCVAYNMSGAVDMFRFGDKGGASRFFYCAKPSRRERDQGLEFLEKKYLATMGDGIGQREHNQNQPSAFVANHHPTVKSLALMRWLTKLVCPVGGLVLDPFAGSCSGGMGAIQEGCRWAGCELSPEYAKIGQARLQSA